MTFIEALQVLAFRDVVCKTPLYRIRAMQRWYSQTFSTPLYVVERDIPLPDVLQHYFEYQFETAEPEDLEETKKLMLETDEQRRVRLIAEDAQAASNEEFHAFLEQEAAKAAAAPKKNPSAPLVPSPARPPGIIPETHLPDTLPKDLPPEIEMKFVSPEELEQKLEEFGQVPVPARR
jgi:hypothetical protein